MTVHDQVESAFTIAGIRTHGVCPQCSWNWIITACLSCKHFSPHEDWYHAPNGESDGAHEAEKVLEEA